MQIEITKEYLENLNKIIELRDKKAASKLLDDLHAADIADLYDNLTIEQAKFLFLQITDGDKAADVIAELNDYDRERFLKVIPSEVIANRFIHYMDSDDAADVLADISLDKRAEVLEHVEDITQAGDIVDLMRYDEDSAGGLMAKEYVAVNWNAGIVDAIEEIRKRAEEVDDVYYVYVVDDNNILKGALSLKRLILESKSKKIRDIYQDDVVSVSVDMDASDVSNIADKYGLVVLPVVDLKHRLVGQITIDDIVDFLRDEAEKDYQMVSGISDDIEPSDSVWKITRARLPWLLVGLTGGILGALVIGIYEEQLQQHAAMAFFIPLIAAMGGNVGVQSSSIVVQALANNSLNSDSIFNKVIKELLVAVMNGLVLSTIILIYNMLFGNSQALTYTVSIALFVVILFASVFGTIVPLVLNKYKIDPALATGPFITTANDIVGLLIYLAVGAVLFTIF